MPISSFSFPLGINIGLKKVASMATGLKDETIFFSSRTKSPFNVFSNFYEVDIAMPEGVFPSVEHYFQGMKFVPGDRDRFLKDGELNTENKNDKFAGARLAKSAGSKTGSRKRKLSLADNGLDRERAKRVMKDALHVKFSSEPLRSLLLETDDRLLVHIPSRGKTDFWTGKKDKATGEIVGENKMAVLLMEVRDELRQSDNK